MPGAIVEITGVNHKSLVDMLWLTKADHQNVKTSKRYVPPPGRIS